MFDSADVGLKRVVGALTLFWGQYGHHGLPQDLIKVGLDQSRPQRWLRNQDPNGSDSDRMSTA